MFRHQLDSHTRWLVALAMAVVVAAAVVICTALINQRWRLGSAPRTTSTAGASSTPGASWAPGVPPSASSAPTSTFAVGVRRLSLSRAADRPLPTTVWYPARGYPDGQVRSDAQVAAGRFPLVLFSHGLPSLPETYVSVTTRLAAAGFVVAAPTYPRTNSHAYLPTMIDVPNQPADAFYVIDSVLRLDAQAGDPFAGHLSAARYAAVGHSAGGFTTGGMLTSPHDPRLASVVIIAGGLLGPCVAPAAEVLFVHGDADQTISYRDGRAAYYAVPWPKAFLTVGGGDHIGYLTAGRPGFDPTITTITDFLRATLYGDSVARQRLPADGSRDGARFERL